MGGKVDGEVLTFHQERGTPGIRFNSSVQQIDHDTLHTHLILKT
jgi:hypothetical protein